MSIPRSLWGPRPPWGPQLVPPWARLFFRGLGPNAPGFWLAFRVEALTGRNRFGHRPRQFTARLHGPRKMGPKTKVPERNQLMFSQKAAFLPSYRAPGRKRIRSLTKIIPAKRRWGKPTRAEGLFAHGQSGTAPLARPIGLDTDGGNPFVSFGGGFLQPCLNDVNRRAGRTCQKSEMFQFPLGGARGFDLIPFAGPSAPRTIRKPALGSGLWMVPPWFGRRTSRLNGGAGPHQFPGPPTIADEFIHRPRGCFLVRWDFSSALRMDL